MKSISQDIEIIRQRITAAYTRVGRKPKEIKLLLATKTVTPECIKIMLKVGNTLIVENKVRELKEKYEAPEDVPHTNHLIGHLQTDKIRKALRYEVSCVEPVDHVDLAQKLRNRLASEGKELDIFIQVDASSEENRFGAGPTEMFGLVRQVTRLPTLHIKGLIIIGLFSAEIERVRAYSKLLKRLQQEIITLGLPDIDPQKLSMGMNGNLETAIKEGATIVRVRMAIFG